MISPYSYDECCKEIMLKHSLDKMQYWFDSLSESKIVCIIQRRVWLRQ